MKGNVPSMDSLLGIDRPTSVQCAWTDERTRAPLDGKTVPRCPHKADRSPVGNRDVMRFPGLQKRLEDYCSHHRNVIFSVILNTSITEWFAGNVKVFRTGGK